MAGSMQTWVLGRAAYNPVYYIVALTYQRVVKGAMRDDGRGNRIPDCKVRIAVDGNGTFSRIEAIELRWIGRTHCRKPTR